MFATIGETAGSLRVESVDLALPPTMDHNFYQLMGIAESR